MILHVTALSPQRASTVLRQPLPKVVCSCRASVEQRGAAWSSDVAPAWSSVEQRRRGPSETGQCIQTPVAVAGIIDYTPGEGSMLHPDSRITAFLHAIEQRTSP